MKTDLSVVICTLNRSDLLQQCLESLAGQECAPWAFEVIVVDNGSTDSTRAVVEQTMPELSNLRYVLEPRQGLSIARNTGMQLAQASYLAYIDDDAIAEVGWCRTVCETFASAAADGKEKYAALGGPIEPIFENGRPPWLPKELETSYSLLDLGPSMRPFSPKEYPFGANCAFLREVLMAHPFKEGLGRAGTSLISSEEADVIIRMSKNGYKSLYVPAMRVRHFVPSSRLTVEWLLRRCYAEGLSQRFVDREFMERAWLVGLAPLRLAKALLYRSIGPSDRRMLYRCVAQFNAGVLAGILRKAGPMSA